MTDTTQAPAPTPAPAAEPAAAAPSPAPAVPEVDEFASAFADLNNPTPAPAPAPTPTPAADATNTPAPTPAPAAEPTPTPAPSPAPEYVPPTAEQWAQMQADLEAARKAPPATAAPAPSPAPAPTPAPAAAPIYTPEQETAVSDYLKEWPQVAEGEALVRKGEYADLTKFIFSEVAKYVQPLMDVVPRIETSTQYRELNDLIPDYDAVREPVLEWVDKQPAYLKAAYEQVTSKGTPEEIADLVERFRKETNWVSPAAASTPAPTPAPAATPAPTPAPAAAPRAALPTAAAAAAAALKPVKGSSTTPSKAEDPNDFDGAFKEFSALP